MIASTARGIRAFDRPLQLLLLNQFAINLAFYMLMPYLAEHLTTDLHVAVWLTGLVLGVRNLAQQGMFALGGFLADRLGFKPLIVGGCILRTVGFALLGFADDLPALVVASAATGLAGAMFNPAVRAYVALDAGERRVEAFATFNVFYQAGTLLGPVVGLALVAVNFQLAALLAAGVFAVLTVLQVRSLPPRRGGAGSAPGRKWTSDWRIVCTNRAFLLFAGVMAISYVLTFQIYLALPIAVQRHMPSTTGAAAATAALFVVSGTVAVIGQLRLTAWCKRNWGPERSLVMAFWLMAAAFLFPGFAASLPPDRFETGVDLWLTALLAAAVLLAVGSALAYPFEMDVVVRLARNELVATHYGVYNTVAGVGITAGNLTAGALIDGGDRLGAPMAAWLILSAVGAFGGLAMASLCRSRRLEVGGRM